MSYVQYSKPNEKQIDALKPQPVEGLNSFDIKGLVNYINTKHPNKIIFLLGAGISCAAGIPDFRTPGTGIYYNLRQFNLPEPESIFDIEYFKTNPKPFYKLAKKTMPGKYKPTLAHYLPVIFHKHNLLKRVYTQNIDGLERIAGVPSNKLVECHGTYYKAHCLKCQKEYDLKDIRGQMEKGEVPKCKKCKDGVIKPDIVFFGENMPDRYFELSKKDFKDCDLFIIIGTSLQVCPVNYLPTYVDENVPRILINNEIVNTYEEELLLTSIVIEEKKENPDEKSENSDNNNKNKAMNTSDEKSKKATDRDKNKAVNNSNEKSKKSKGKSKNKAVKTSNEKSKKSKGKGKNKAVKTSDEKSENSEDKDKNENVNASDENSKNNYTTIQIIENIYDEKINRDNFFSNLTTI